MRRAALRCVLSTTGECLCPVPPTCVAAGDGPVRDGNNGAVAATERTGRGEVLRGLSLGDQFAKISGNAGAEPSRSRGHSTRVGVVGVAAPALRIAFAI